MRSYYKNGFAKHYVRDHDVLRIKAATNNVYKDYSINKAVENLAPLRDRMHAITTRYQDVQQDILETFSTGANCAASPRLPCFLPGNAYPDSSWITLANSLS